MSRLLPAALFALVLAACGQQSAPSSAAPEAPAAAPAAAPATSTPSNSDVQAQVAALPAPYNAADYENGRRVFAQCRSCHVIEAGAGNRVGPNLHGVFGRASGQAANFRYSPAMQNAHLTWDGPTLDHYLENPRAQVPGTLMAFAGIRRPDDRRDVIAYIAVESQR